MIIIGILAAIAIPIFLNQRSQANQAACRSDLRNGAAAANSYAAAQPTGNFVNMDAAALQNAPYDWNLSAPSSNPVVDLAANNNYALQVDCAGAPLAQYHFITTTGRVTDGPAPAVP